MRFDKHCFLSGVFGTILVAFVGACLYGIGSTIYDNGSYAALAACRDHGKFTTVWGSTYECRAKQVFRSEAAQ